jgi:hypothetical protein
MYKPPAFREGDQTNLSNIRSCVSELSLRSILGDLRNNDGFAPSFQSFETHALPYQKRTSQA